MQRQARTWSGRASGARFTVNAIVNGTPSPSSASRVCHMCDRRVGPYSSCYVAPQGTNAPVRTGSPVITLIFWNYPRVGRFLHKRAPGQQAG